MRTGRPVRTIRVVLLSITAIVGIGLAAVIGGSDVTGREEATASAEPAGGALLAIGQLADRLRLGGGPDRDHTIVWTSGGLPPGFVDALDEVEGVRSTVTTRGDRVDLTASWDADGEPVDRVDDGWVIPLEGFAVDPDGLAHLAPRGVRRTVSGLGEGEALLSETSAEVRGIGVGGSLAFGGERLEVVGVVPDRYVGAAEVIVDVPTGQRLGIEMERFVIVSHDGGAASLEEPVRALLGSDTPVRITPVDALDQIRQGSGVLPQSHVKQRFGEFALRDHGRRGFEQDPAWVEENIRTERVPLLGRITCHKDYFPAIRGALQELEDRGIGHLVTVRDYGGCWTPRFSGARRSISRHAWGITADFNISRNPYGAEPDQDPRLVEVMESWGMNWGGTWLVPDAMHFEHVEFPDR